MTAQSSASVQPLAAAPPEVPIRWIPTCRRDGGWQMAADAWLLERLVARAGPHGGEGGPGGVSPAAPAVFRLYRWSRPTLSLGRHQRRLEPHWWELQRQGRLDLVRRPTGGRAVLHGGDLTYALVWPRPPGGRLAVYGRALEWLQQAFAALGQPLRSGRQAVSLQRSSCFATATAADLVHADGAKRVGSAQLWRSGHLLQHGSIQIDPCPDLWRQVFGTDPPPLPPLPLAGTALEAHLLDAAARWLPRLAAAGDAIRVSVPAAAGGPPPFTPLEGTEQAGIAALRSLQRPVASPSGETSPELTMPRAT